MAEAVEEGGPEVLTPSPPVEEAEDIGVEIGDIVSIVGGTLDKTVGRFYGFSEDRITIQPKGSTHMVIHIELEDGAPKEEYGMEEMKIIKKATRPGFITMLDMRAGQIAETFTSSGEQTGTFRVISVDIESDSAVFQDDTGDESHIEFNFQGIPRDLPFQVIRTREPPPAMPPSMSEGEAEARPVPVGEVEERDLALGEGPGEEGVDAPSDFAVLEEIELAINEEVKELTSSERIYPDVLQRSEMFAQLIRLLPEAQQKNAIKLQEIRRLVEVFMIMRNTVVEYGATGEPRGSKTTSYTYLSELIQNPELYLSRKVVPITKHLYLSHAVNSENGERNHDAEPPTGHLYEEGKKTGLYVNFQDDILNRANAFNESAEVETGERPASQMPKLYTDLEAYKKSIHTPHETLNGKHTFQRDEEVFRTVAPDFDDASLIILKKIYDARTQRFVPTTKTPFGIARLLKPRVGRFLSGERTRVVESGDAYTSDTVLLFPRSVIREIGPIRSGYFVQDVSLAMKNPRLLSDILKDLSVDEVPTADGILQLGLRSGSGSGSESGTILGNVEIKDWLENQDLVLTGMADVFRLLHGYGIQNVEWNQSQMSVFIEKIEQHIASLRIHLAKQREENASDLANLRFEPNNLLSPEQSAGLLSVVKGEPILQKVLEELEEQVGELAYIDTNWFSYIFLKYPDFVLSVLGKQPEIVTKERLRNVRQKFLEAMTAAYRAKTRAKEAGDPPMPNKCKHVEDLMNVRKAAQANADEPHDVTKMRLLIKFIGKYRGKTEDNWISCNICHQHLICAHEHLQIQEFVRPKEKEVLHKELILKFSGGQFGGKYICRVCGQAIQDLDFDTNLEFDDEGRPMMGRSVMVDTEQIEIDEMDELLSGPADKKEEIDFGDEKRNEMYRTLKTITGLVGISPEEEDYRKMVSQLSEFEATLPTLEQYALIKPQEGKKKLDYNVYNSSRYMAAAAVIVLLNVQTHIPEYIIYYTNTECRNGLSGYPLEGPENTTGIQCIASVIAGINENVFPWNSTGLQKLSDYSKRTNLILPIVTGLVEKFSKTPVTQLQLQRKREYQKKSVGYVGTKKLETIGKSFRPIPYVIPVEEAAADAIMAEAATPEKKATAWIQTAHRLARDGSAINPDSPFTETTCCLHKITNPAEFWTESTSKLPSLEKKTIGKPPFRTATVNNTFYTDTPESIVGKTNPSEFSKLFTRVCYKGERKGMPHELGLGEKPKCFHCEINFPMNPSLTQVPELLPASDSPADAKTRQKEQIELIKVYETELKAHIEAQGIVINEETFNDLLHVTQINMKAQKDVLPSEPRKEDAFSGLAGLRIHPIENWAAYLAEIDSNMRELRESPSEMQIANAAERLVTVIREKETLIKSKIGEKAFQVLETIAQKLPRECGETINTYLVIPFQRWLSQRGPKNFEILKSYELSSETRDDIMQRGLGTHLELLQKGKELKGILKRKVSYLIRTLTIITSQVSPYLRKTLIPGGELMVIYIQRALLMGFIANYLDSNFIPEDSMVELEEDGAAPEIKMLAQALNQALTKYVRGSYVPNDEEIRTTLARRTEMENQKFLKRLDKMASDRRKVEIELKKKGMGEWAVGGTLAIRKYDADRYEAERIERAQAGIQDYQPMPGEEGRAFDMFGYVTQEGNVDEAAGEYGQPQEGDDDA